MKKKIILIITGILTLCIFAGCSGEKESFHEEITVISREEGSGTRTACEEFFGIDKTIATADISYSTGFMITSVAQNPSAIGYVSLGALNKTVKALKIEGAEATIENVKSGTYKISRPFNIITKEGLSETAQDFVDYILSTEGQLVIKTAGYIPNDESYAYSGTRPEGKISVSGSSSVTPLMEKLKKTYMELNPHATIEIQQTDSSSGISSTAEGACDIGMVSRELKDDELAENITSTVIATDCIAIIVNSKNPLEDITTDQVKAIYSGETINWSEVE